jgi:hypothetical protein
MIKKLIACMTLGVMLMPTTWLVAAKAQARLFDIQGEVKDEHGDVIVGAKVGLVGAQDSTRAVITDGQGRWRLSGLAVGPYKLKVSADGFSAEELSCRQRHPETMKNKHRLTDSLIGGTA